MKSLVRVLCLSVVVYVGCTLSAVAGEATIATAANFVFAAEQIKSRFQSATGHVITLVSSSTGKLASQASLGAPFDVLLAADQARPQRLIKDGHAVAGSQFTYARGRLALWSGDADIFKNASVAQVLTAGHYRRLAIANPALAPYGVAAWQVLQGLGLDDVARTKLIYGENVQQAYAFAASGNTELALVALSFVRGARNADHGAYGEVPNDLHDPILQDAVLLKRGQDNGAAIAFMKYLSDAEAQHIIKELGYAGSTGSPQ